MVAIGTMIWTFWIISANSWMQTPQGYSLDAQGVFYPESWWAIVFNPSFPYRLAHMVLAAFITTCFVIGGVSAWYLRRGVHVEAGKRMLKHAVAFAAIAVPLQIFVGDLHGLNAVSYTHLDVYKRQDHAHAERDREDLQPEEIQVPPEVVLRAQPAPVEEGQPARQAKREGREQDVERNHESELDPG